MQLCASSYIDSLNFKLGINEDSCWNFKCFFFFFFAPSPYLVFISSFWPEFLDLAFPSHPRSCSVNQAQAELWPPVSWSTWGSTKTSSSRFACDIPSATEGQYPWDSSDLRRPQSLCWDLFSVLSRRHLDSISVTLSLLFLNSLILLVVGNLGCLWPLWSLS